MFPRQEALRPEFIQWRFAFATPIPFVHMHNAVREEDKLVLGQEPAVGIKGTKFGALDHEDGDSEAESLGVRRL